MTEQRWHLRKSRQVLRTLCALTALAPACNRERLVPTVARPASTQPTARSWLKGQTHLHSGNSGDSETPPSEVARYYAEQGFDFIVYTDHNRVTRLSSTGSLLVIPGVELTQNLDDCDPAAPGLRGCNLHMNALFVTPGAPTEINFPENLGPERLAVYTRELEMTRAYGGLAQLNHPNFRWGADAALVTELSRRGVALMEIWNGSGDCSDEGDAQHPSTEALWDQALSAGQRLYGVATDDAHHYYDADAVRSRGELAYVGNRGWVMVRAARDPAAIRAALQAGDFYASTGVKLATLTVSAASLELAVTPETPSDCEFRFIGSGGRELTRSRGRSARFALNGIGTGYVRAVITDDAGHKAWVQPVWAR